MIVRDPVARVLALVCALVIAIATQGVTQGARDTIWVAPTGASGVGTRALPFTRLEEARDQARALRAQGKWVVVVLRGGDYPREISFVLGAEDGGSLGAPAIWTSLPGESPRIRGARRVTLHLVSGRSPVVAALSSAARARVRAIQVAGEQGEVHALGDGNRPRIPELFSDNEPLVLARWPATGWRKIAQVDSSDGGVRIGLDLPFERNGSGRGAELVGYFRWDWASGRIPLDSTGGGRLSVPRGRSVYGWIRGQRVAVVNHPAGLTRAGRYLFDPTTKQILVWPGRRPPRWVAVLDEPVITIRGARHLRLEGVTVGWTGGTAIQVEESDSIVLDRLAVRYTGGNGIVVRGGRGVQVTRTEIVGAGYSGLVMEGGDRLTLTPGGHLAEDDRILRSARWSPTRRSVHLLGVGQRVVHTEIADAPFEAILVQGNDHLIEADIIHHLLRYSRDAGAIYLGRDWTERGTVIRRNLFHDIGGLTHLGGNWEVSAIYLDDGISGVTIEGNLFLRVPGGIHVGGGRDNLIARNAFLCSDPAVFLSFRGEWTEPLWKMRDKLRAMHFDQLPYSERYPALARILDGDPWDPLGNVLDSNLVTGTILATHRGRAANVTVRGTMSRRGACSGTQVDRWSAQAARRSGLPFPTLATVGPRGAIGPGARPR